MRTAGRPGARIRDQRRAGQDIVYNIAIMTEGTVMTSAGVRDKGNESSLIARVQVLVRGCQRVRVAAHTESSPVQLPGE